MLRRLPNNSTSIYLDQLRTRQVMRKAREMKGRQQRRTLSISVTFEGSPCICLFTLST